MIADFLPFFSLPYGAGRVRLPDFGVWCANRLAIRLHTEGIAGFLLCGLALTGSSGSWLKMRSKSKKSGIGVVSALIDIFQHDKHHRTEGTYLITPIRKSGSGGSVFLNLVTGLYTWKNTSYGRCERLLECEVKSVRTICKAEKSWSGGSDQSRDLAGVHGAYRRTTSAHRPLEIVGLSANTFVDDLLRL